MATTVTGSGSAIGADKTLDRRFGSPGNGKGRGNGGPNGKGPGGNGSRHDSGTPRRYRIGILAGIASILMMFSALASAYIVRSGFPGQNSSLRIPVPSFIWVSTALILASSLTMSLAVRSQRKGNASHLQRWLEATLLLGIGFLASQLMAWRELVAQGVYLASNPHSSFFYLLTGLHGVHLLGGITGLAYLMYFVRWKNSGARAELKQRTLTDVVALYWHFMDGLWVFLFLLLFFWR